MLTRISSPVCRCCGDDRSWPLSCRPRSKRPSRKAPPSRRRAPSPRRAEVPDFACAASRRGRGQLFAPSAGVDQGVPGPTRSAAVIAESRASDAACNIEHLPMHGWVGHVAAETSLGDEWRASVPLGITRCRRLAWLTWTAISMPGSASGKRSSYRSYPRNPKARATADASIASTGKHRQRRRPPARSRRRRCACDPAIGSEAKPMVRSAPGSAGPRMRLVAGAIARIVERQRPKR